MAAKLGIDEPDPQGERAREAAQRQAAARHQADSALAQLTSPETAERIKTGARAVGVALGVGILVIRPLLRRIRGR